MNQGPPARNDLPKSRCRAVRVLPSSGWSEAIFERLLMGSLRQHRDVRFWASSGRSHQGDEFLLSGRPV